MSYIDDNRIGYSYPLLSGISLESPTFPPATGPLPNNSVNILVDDANYRSTIDLPTGASEGLVLTVMRTSANPVQVSHVGTDLDLPVDVSQNETVRFVMTSTGWKWLAHDVSIPNVIMSAVGPAPGAPRVFQAGDVWVQTVDGTANTPTIATWITNGIGWSQIGSVTETLAARPPINVGALGREFMGIVSANSGPWTVATEVTAASLAAKGFTAVGAATITGATAPISGRAGFDIAANAPVPDPFPNDATLFAIPADYVRHEVAITPAVDNQYHLYIAADRVCAAVVWICDKVSGTPILRLYGQTISGSNNGRHTTLQMTALNETGWDHDTFEWIGFTIPKALIDAHKTATNTIKLAITAGPGNSPGNAFTVAGYSMAEAKFAFTVVTAYGAFNRINGGDSVGLNLATAVIDGMGSVTIASGGSTDCIRIPVVDTTKDLLVSLVGTSGTNGGSVNNAEMSLKSSAGLLPMLRPRQTLKSPLAMLTVVDVGGGHDVGGWAISARQIAKFAVKPANSAISYLQLRIVNTSTNDNIQICSVVSEVIS